MATTSGIFEGKSMVKDLYFPSAYVTLTDTHLLTAASRYEWPDLLYAEVVTRKEHVDWWSFAQTNTLVFFVFAVIWALATSLGWISIAGPIVAIWWLFITIYGARDEVKKSYKHTLTLETNSGTVEVTTSNNENAMLEVCEAISRRIKRNAAAPKPVNTGEATRWIRAN